MAEDKKVRGELLVDLVRAVRAREDLPWEKYLTPEDMEIVNSMVIPSSWYPLESYRRIMIGNWELIAKRDRNIMREYTRHLVNEMLKGPYGPHLDRGDPYQAMTKFMELRRRLFNFSQWDMEKKGEKQMLLRLSQLGNIEDIDIYILHVCDYLHALAEYNGAKDVEFEIQETNEQGESAYVINISWK
jgi:hypothetical protein